ncbi:uncharacterized protein LOC108631809 [Ceratina calcarata]|uniref:Uncharacterized protein LOC108631809 n=1 Tax=Ceratina calcarata TaxID=156304 RepID=A0AAJ7NEK2_9HYME|nr:uncharacterized protein LOC108631809 [Ceratina calcarata]
MKELPRKLPLPALTDRLATTSLPIMGSGLWRDRSEFSDSRDPRPLSRDKEMQGTSKSRSFALPGNISCCSPKLPNARTEDWTNTATTRVASEGTAPNIVATIHLRPLPLWIVARSSYTFRSLHAQEG